MLNRKVLIRLILIVSGGGIILLSLFAFQLGLDNDPGWGPRRFQILTAGLAVVLFGASYWITPALSGWLGQRLKDSSLRRRMGESLQEGQASSRESLPDAKGIGKFKQSRWFDWLSRNQMNIWLLLMGCCVLWAYVWIITIGRVEKWPSGREYYWLLTQAFQRGQPYLLVEPNPELLQLENPYDLQQRKGVEYLWDTTLYNGKYYLYWGPVPAVLGVMFNFVTSRPIRDAGLVFFFVAGTALFSILLLRRLYQDDKLPVWLFWGGALVSVLNIPSVWLFTHPAYYEASIAGGQFFMMAGFFLLYAAFRHSSLNKGQVFLAALAFGLGGAARVSLLPSVIFLAFVILWRIHIFYECKFSAAIPAFVAAMLPMALIACSLGWYNYIRFGSVFEFGHRYQLSGLSMTENYEDQVSINYIVPNLYTYVFRLPSLSGEFPFVTISWIREDMWPFFIRLPENYYYPEPTAGVLLLLPIVGFATIVLIRLFWLLLNGDISLTRDKEQPADNLLSWFGLSMLGYVLIQLSVLLVFISAALRYLFDLSPALIILSTMFVGYHLRSIETKSYVRNLFMWLWLVISALTVVSGFLIGLTGSQNNFLNKNPQLYYQLMEWFRP